jgi:hypothetical protein
VLAPILSCIIDWNGRTFPSTNRTDCIMPRTRLGRSTKAEIPSRKRALSLRRLMTIRKVGRPVMVKHQTKCEIAYADRELGWPQRFSGAYFGISHTKICVVLKEGLPAIPFTPGLDHQRELQKRYSAALRRTVEAWFPNHTTSAAPQRFIGRRRCVVRGTRPSSGDER